MPTKAPIVGYLAAMAFPDSVVDQLWLGFRDVASPASTTGANGMIGPTPAAVQPPDEAANMVSAMGPAVLPTRRTTPAVASTAASVAGYSMRV